MGAVCSGSDGMHGPPGCCPGPPGGTRAREAVLSSTLPHTVCGNTGSGAGNPTSRPPNLARCPPPLLALLRDAASSAPIKVTGPQGTVPLAGSAHRHLRHGCVHPSVCPKTGNAVSGGAVDNLRFVLVSPALQKGAVHQPPPAGNSGSRTRPGIQPVYEFLFRL